MEIYLKLIDVFFPVFLVIGIGFYFGKKNPKFDTYFITKLTGTFGTPALIFYSLTSTGVNLETFIEFFTYKIIMVSGFAFVGIITLILTKRDIIYELPPLILPNNGNIGLSVCLFAYGKIGLAIATATTAMRLIFHFSIGMLLASKKFSLKPLLKCTPVYALIISLIFVYYEIPSPKFL